MTLRISFPKLTVIFPAGDAMVREVDLSRITVRLVEKVDKKGDGDEDHVISKLSGDLLPVLQRCLVRSFGRSSRWMLTTE